MDEKEPVSLLEAPMSYSLVDDKGTEIQAGECVGRLEKEKMMILTESGLALSMPYRNILDIEEKDYRINLTLSSKEKLALFYLGYYYDDFLRMLMQLRNEVLLKDLLMHETLKKRDVEAEFSYFDEEGKEKHSGDCKVRLYETGLVVIPSKSEMFRIPCSDLLEVKEEDYTLIITTDFGEKLVLSKMGWETDSFKRMLITINNELQSKVLTWLQELLADANPLILRRIAQFMKEGKAARRVDIESVSPNLWFQLEKRLEATGIKEEYDFLEDMAQKDEICVGMKRGLMGDLTGEYLWLLLPIYSTDPHQLGNAVAMLATTGEGEGGRATYFFRVVPRRDYSNFRDIKELHSVFDKFIKRINRCMLDINFRREPIYLPDERLEEPQYFRYKFAVRKLPSLQILRNLFIGRVIRTSEEQWRKDVMSLLSFNVSTQDDFAKWRKG